MYGQYAYIDEILAREVNGLHKLLAPQFLDLESMTIDAVSGEAKGAWSAASAGIDTSGLEFRSGELTLP